MPNPGDTDSAAKPDGGESPSQSNGGGDGRQQRKVDRVADKYDFHTFKDEMLTRYEADKGGDTERWGARRSAKEFNKQIVERVLQDQIADRPPLGTTEDIVEILSSDPDEDDIDIVEYNRIVDWFNDHNVDPHELSDDFVNYRTVWQYLKQVQDAETPDLRISPEERKRKAIDDGRDALDRTKKVARENIDALQRTDQFPNTDVEIRPRVRVLCNNCDRVRPYEKYVENGCYCDPED